MKVFWPIFGHIVDSTNLFIIIIIHRHLPFYKINPFAWNKCYTLIFIFFRKFRTLFFPSSVFLSLNISNFQVFNFKFFNNLTLKWIKYIYFCCSVYKEIIAVECDSKLKSPRKYLFVFAWFHLRMKLKNGK